MEIDNRGARRPMARRPADGRSRFGVGFIPRGFQAAARTRRVKRTLGGWGWRESLFTTLAAWLAAVFFFAVLVLAYQWLVYDPAGLQLDFFSPTPWLFTLPVPAAVIIAGGAALAVMLSRIDAVAIIERR